MMICFDQDIQPLGEPRYRLNGTPTAAIHRFMFLTEPVFPTSMWVNGVTTPWNRITIIPGILPSTLRASFRCLNRSRRFNPRLWCVPYRDVLMSRAQDAQERPLLYTPVDAPFNPSNCGF
jgi:hypothetical protein